ncbi:hypothetical protein [Glycomyces tarimensis]
MTRVSQWNWTEFGQEWSQTRAINEIDAELAAQRRTQQRHIQQTKNELKGDLQRVDSRLSSVADRVDTVLEWTELRFQLLEFEEYTARKEIRKTFRALAGGLPTAVPDVEDVPGYWMPPAAMAVLPLVLRDRASVPRQGGSPFTDRKSGLETARERDPIRAELFNLTVGVCFAQPVFVDAAVLRLLGEPVDLGLAEPGQVAAGWRALWEHAAQGEFGTAVEHLGERLKALFDPRTLDESELRAWDQAILAFGTVEGAPPAKPAAFAALAGHLAAPAPPPLPAAEPDQRWRRYLQELIEEPSPAELPLVRAMEELHLPEDRLQRSEPTWAAPEGTVAELLRRDLFDPEGPAALRSLAFELAAPLLRSRVEHLAAPPESRAPITRTVKRVGAKVTVDRDGHDKAEFEAARQRLERGFDLEGPSTTFTAAACGGLGVAALLSLVFLHWILTVLFVAGAAVLLWHHYAALAKQVTNREHCDRQIADLRSELDRAKDLVREAERERAERAAEAERARDELMDALKVRLYGLPSHAA